MKRLPVHVAVHDLQQSIRFYRALFDAGLGQLRAQQRAAGAACCTPAP